MVALIYFIRAGLLGFKFRKKHALNALKFGFPLIFHTLGKFVVNQSDRVFLAKMLNKAELGVYNIGYQVGMVVMVLINALANVMSPYVMKRLETNSEESRREIVKAGLAYFGALGLVYLGTNLGAPIVFLFVDEKFADGLNYVPWISLGYIFWGIYIFFTEFISFIK